jgi:hypothetical protein
VHAFKSDSSDCPNFSNLTSPPASPPPSQPVTLIDTGERGVSKILLEDNPTSNDAIVHNRLKPKRRKSTRIPVVKTYRVGEVRGGNPIHEAMTPTGPATIRDIAHLFNELAGKPESTVGVDLKPAPWKKRDLRFNDPADDRCAQCDCEPTGEEHTLQLRGCAGYACLHPWCWEHFCQQINIEYHDTIDGLATKKRRPMEIILRDSARSKAMVQWLTQNPHMTEDDFWNKNPLKWPYDHLEARAHFAPSFTRDHSLICALFAGIRRTIARATTTRIGFAGNAGKKGNPND